MTAVTAPFPTPLRAAAARSTTPARTAAHTRTDTGLVHDRPVDRDDPAQRARWPPAEWPTVATRR